MGSRRSTTPPPSNRRRVSARPRAASPRGGQPHASFGAFDRVDSTLSDGSSRAVFVLVAFAVLAVVLLGRLVYLQVIQAGELSAMAQDSRTISYEVNARRGTIYDRNGLVLATSVEATTIYANPKEVSDPRGAANQLAAILGGEPDWYYEQLTQEDTSFVYIQRQADVELAERVEKLGIRGVYFIADTKREYPYGEVGGQVIGFVGVDGEGLSGLELQYDDILSGTPGSVTIEQGNMGTPMPGGVREETPAVDGQDIIVSLDITLQAYVEERLVQCVDDMNAAEGGSVVVMDAGTGEIYATASLPLYNPNDPNSIEDASATQAKAITQILEPGSIFKTVSMTAVLEESDVTPETELFCPAYLQADEFWISDAHERGDETMTLRQILDNSSNVGISLAVENFLGFAPLYEKLAKYNLNELTGVDYPGEGLGYLADVSDWSKIQAYNITFGQGISVTPLQMVRFYGALANDGVEVTPHFLIEKPLTNEKPEYATEEVIENKEAIATVTDMLETVVENGTGSGAQIEGYRVAGKTSTAEIAEGGVYKDGVFNLCFTGFLPGSSSQLVCFVGANEVPGDGTVSNAFRDIMAFAIDRYRITPAE